MISKPFQLSFIIFKVKSDTGVAEETRPILKMVEMAEVLLDCFEISRLHKDLVKKPFSLKSLDI